MTQRNDMIRIRHMLDHAREAVDLIAGEVDLPPLIAEIEAIIARYGEK